MTNKVKCFISYCHEDIDRNVLEYLIYHLEKDLENEYEFLLDSNLAYGADLNNFMDLLNEVSAVIILMTPAYKRKVSERDGGAYEEFARTFIRYKDINEELKAEQKKIYEVENYFELIPILFSGSHQNAVLEEITHLKYLNITSLFVRKNKSGNFSVPHSSEREFLNELDKIVSRLRFVSNFRNQTQETLYEKYYERLFIELRADWQNPRDSYHNYDEHLFVTTHSYKKIAEQSVYFLIGRKGIGKSTITDLLAFKNRNKYEGIARLIANDFDLEMAYTFFSWEQIRSDLRHIAPPLKSFKFAWEAFMYLCCMHILVDKRRNGELNGYQEQLTLIIESHLNGINQSNRSTNIQTFYTGYFIFCWNAIIRFIKECIDEARSDEEFFLADIKFKFNRNNFLDYLFGEKILINFDDLLKSFRKKILITLDGFDTIYDEFRRISINQYNDHNAQQRVNFELNWLRSLLHLILDIKQFGQQSIIFHKYLDFCITLPDDRFYEIYQIDRDAFLHVNRYRSLDWSGIELSILLRKRLEELAQYSTDAKLNPAERLNRVMRVKYPNLPQEINFKYNGNEYAILLFFYVLRHTFWRPREILMHYAQIIAYAENSRIRNQKISTETIRRLIQEASREVIETEFINEFQSSVKNIKEIIESFSRQDNILSYPKIFNILGSLRFWFVSGDVEPISVEEKLIFLYRIGFLGVKVSEEMKERLNISNSHSFYFNEGLVIMRKASNQTYEKYTFIIHPIFTEYLQLNTDKSELILELTWDYLHDMEDILSGSGFSRFLNT